MCKGELFNNLEENDSSATPQKLWEEQPCRFVLHTLENFLELHVFYVCGAGTSHWPRSRGKM